MSFTYRLSPDDIPSSLWLCLCRECGKEWEREMEADVDEETGRVVFHKPSECPNCGSYHVIVETN